MEDERKFKRLPIELSARYLKENEKEWKGCTIINISREGMGIEVYVRERIPENSTLQLDIDVPEKDNSIKVKGILRWIKELQEEMDFVGGIEFSEIDAEDKWTLLSCAYDVWPEKERGYHHSPKP